VSPRPFRFTFIILLAAVGTGLSAFGGWRFARASAPVNGPIILISIDTLRADHLPAYGYRKIKTPAIDTLAADGTVFERAYSHAPLTLPAHAAILSGRLPFETGIRDNVGFTVKAGERLLPQMLRDRGFNTAGVVSSYVLRRETGIDQGFEFFDGNMPPAVDEAWVGPIQRDGKESESIAERWLEQQRSSRVFLFLHLYEPHKPYSSRPEFAAYSPYDAEIAYTDEVVGRLIRYLKSHQLYDQSTIVLLSDHGEGLGDHGEQEHGLFVYDEAIHVPLIIKQAAGAGAGRRVHDVVQHIDVAPTILDLAKAPIPGNLRGRSLKVLLDGGGQLPSTAVYSEALYGHFHFGWSELTALTDEKYQYISAPREELYDLADDPRETRNIVADRAEAHSKLRAALEHMNARAIKSPAIEASVDDRQHLELLGYSAVHAEPAATSEGGLADPKDTVEVVEAYRRAGELIAGNRLPPAIDILQSLAHDYPSTQAVWQRLGDVLQLAGRGDQAAHAYERSAALGVRDVGAPLAAATVLYRLGRLEDAQRYAETARALAQEQSPPSAGAPQELLAKIAVARKDFDAAREYAAEAKRASPSTPLVSFVEGLIAYSEGRFEDALDPLQAAAAGTSGRSARPTEVHFYLGETLAHLARFDEAIDEFNAELLRSPRHSKARAGLAAAYAAAGRDDDAERTLTELVDVARTPEGYALAAHVWSSIGQPRRAESLRAEARHLFKSARPSN
jgi:choline-sulfatase